MPRSSPRHLRPPASRRRGEARHHRPPTVHLGSLSTLGATVIGAAVVASSTYGFVPSPVSAADGVSLSQVGSTLSSPGDSLLASAQAARQWAILGAGGTIVDPPAPDSPQVDEARLEPAFISIPAISTTSPLIQLGLTADRTLEVPVDFGTAGWYRLGPRPGDPGPAVIAGHLDSYSGPAVFARLDQVKPGDQVLVTRRDGSTLEFAVTRIDQYPKRAFPTRQVYGPTDAPELRIITCGGTFDRSAGSYRNNTVVYARLVGS